MNTAQWHLLLNHIPLVSTIIGSLILLTGFIFNNKIVKQTALGVFLFSALMAIPVYLTGEGAEEVVENLYGIDKNIIESHEDLGKTFLIVAGVLGILAFITLIADWIKNKYASMLYILVMIVAIGTSVFAKQVGTSGGEIRHTEIRSGVTDQQGDKIQKDNGGDND